GFDNFAKRMLQALHIGIYLLWLRRFSQGRFLGLHESSRFRDYTAVVSVRNCIWRSFAPIHAVGIAVSKSATAYQCWPTVLLHVAKAARVHTSVTSAPASSEWPIGRLGASRAIT